MKTATVPDRRGYYGEFGGKYVAVWKKQQDGSWKVEADMFNSDLPSGTTTSAQRSQSLTPPPPAQ